ncbi:MFS transporter [Jiangella mangrovi]|uniref:MFS family permease n=1 Tax=Jiangella mangrovi TaxID=1524084 RepID=A0A7W9GMK0_9ACTN|nr:MFS family permease [Jiangella mangrovi]
MAETDPLGGPPDEGGRRGARDDGGRYESPFADRAASGGADDYTGGARPQDPPHEPPHDSTRTMPPPPSAGQRVRRAAGATGRAARTAAAGTSRAARGGATRLHRAAEAKGAGQTGLSRLIELNAASAFADALVTVALAGTLFFSASTSEARGNVALYLLLTMAPFAVVAPVLGPFLDRFSHGRRWAIGFTAATRGFLAWVAADAVIDGGVWLYPAALGVLVGQKAYAVTRAAAVPRLLPEGWTLVAANSRLQLAATLGTAAGAPIGLALAQIGDDWPLRAAFFAYMGTTILAILLPKRVDLSEGEEGASLTEGDDDEQHRMSRSGKRKFRVGPAVVRALRANTALRWLSGFMTMFMAFVLREEPVAGLDDLVLLGIVAAGAWLGSTIGSSVGALVQARSPDRTIIVLVGFGAASTLVTALFWNLLTVILIGLAAGFAQQLGRLSLDAIVQRDVPEKNRSNAFARSETLLQLGWVAGGAVGIVLPLIPWVGMGVATLVMVGGLVFALRVRPQRRRPDRHPADRTPPPSAPAPPPARLPDD